MNKNTLKAAIKNHSEVVLSDKENALVYLTEQGFSEDEANEVLTAILSTETPEVKEEKKSEKPKKEVSTANKKYEVWQLDHVSNERLKLIKTVNGQPNYVKHLNEQKNNTKLEYVEVK